MITSYFILTLAVLALSSDLWRRAAAFVAVNELIEILLYNQMFLISQFNGTNAYLYYAAKDSLLLLCLLIFCAHREGDVEEMPTELFLLPFGGMIVLNLYIHTQIDAETGNFIYQNYETIYMGMQIPLLLVLMIGVQHGFNRTKRGLYERRRNGVAP